MCKIGHINQLVTNRKKGRKHQNKSNKADVRQILNNTFHLTECLKLWELWTSLKQGRLKLVFSNFIAMNSEQSTAIHCFIVMQGGFPKAQFFYVRTNWETKSSYF